MLNPFPELLTYSLLGPFILRLVLALILINLGYFKFKKEKARWIASFEALHIRPADFLVSFYGVLEILVGILLAVGLWTQIAALALLVFTGIELYIEWRDEKILKRSFVFYLLIGAIALSLLLTGAGSFAFDIPL